MRVRIIIFILFVLMLDYTLTVHAQIRCATPNPSYTVPENPSFRKLAVTAISVPVICHVIFDNYGNGNVPESQLRAQVDTLNATYVRSGAQFSFYLAAITRTQKAQWFNLSYGSPSVTEMTDTLAIDPLHAFNVYITQLAGGVLGWVINFPWEVSENSRQNGVIIDYRSMPGGSFTNFNYGYTLVHEAGHYLGLYHTFQNGCRPPGDEVDDTPYQNDGHNIFECNDNLNTLYCTR